MARRPHDVHEAQENPQVVLLAQLADAVVHVLWVEPVVPQAASAAYGHDPWRRVSNSGRRRHGQLVRVRYLRNRAHVDAPST